MNVGLNLYKGDLVLGLDTGYGVANVGMPTRHFKGRPTTNLTTSTLTPVFSNWAGLTGGSSTYTNGYNGNSGVYLYINQGGGVNWWSSPSLTGISASTVYTVSATIKFNGRAHTGNDANIFYIRQYRADNSQITEGGQFSPSRKIHLGDGWYRAWGTFTTTSETNRILLHGYTYDSNTEIFLQDLQFEIGDTASPFAGYNVERDDNQGLIDLTKKAALDLGAMTYDDTGQLDYDGTNDIINLGNYAPLKLGTHFSLEFVVKPEQDKWMYFFHKGYGANNALAWGRHSSGDDWFFSTYISGGYQNHYMGTATLNKHCHLVATYDGANLRLYENGILKITTAKTHQMMDTNTSAGIGGPDRYWNGKIPVAKVYDTVLTTEEVVSNFKAYKNRFNI